MDADSDQLVISSVNEGTPFTVIEAMATGCPVVATSVGGLPDFLDHGRLGALVPSGNADALANAIVQKYSLYAARCQTIADPYRRALRHRPLGRDLEGLYRTLLAEKMPIRQRP